MLDFASIDTALEIASAKIAESRGHIQAQPPELLFHYTNASGVRGILETSRLWATNCRFHNDASEVAYGFAIFESIVHERLATADGDVVRELLERTLRTANAFDGMFDCYIACFVSATTCSTNGAFMQDTGAGIPLALERRKLDCVVSNRIARRTSSFERSSTTM